MLSKNEKQLIKIVRYLPVLLILIISILMTIFLISENNNRFQKELKELKLTYLQSHENKIKSEIDRIVNYINHVQQENENILKKTLKSRAKEVHAILTSIYNQYKNTMPKEQIVQLMKTTIRPIRFNNNRGYFYIHNMQGDNILHATKPSLEGKNLLNMKDIRDVYIVKEIIKSLQNKNDSFNILYWYKPDDMNNEYKKITYHLKFEPYEFIIGTGEYIVDFETNLKQRIARYINKIKYDDNGYIFIIDYNGKQIAHIDKSLIGKNRLEVQDNKGLYLIKEIISLAKEDGGFINYEAIYKPNKYKSGNKISYIKGVDKFSWAIGSGFYIDELNTQIKQKQNALKQLNQSYLIKLIISSLILTILFLGLSIYFSKIFEQKLLKYRRKIKEQIITNRKKDNILAQQSKMAAMGEMLANIAHQWRQPLSTITTASTGTKVKKELNILKDEELISSMDVINDSAQYLSQTIEDFSNYFNPIKTKSKFNVDSLITKSLKIMDSQLLKQNIKIIKIYTDTTITSYENEILQVIINIINNSKDEFIKNNQNNGLIKITTIEQNNTITFNIHDNAGGIPSSIISRIFEPYFTTKHKSKGTGIGLYMCREIITKHMGGELNASNEFFYHNDEKYFGAKFSITIPLEI